MLINFWVDFKVIMSDVEKFSGSTIWHPDLKLQNINIIFLPPNTTSHCQPLNQGAFQNFKVIYGQMILRYILSQIKVVKVLLI